jgi:membrane protease YdiL (CAAX protease family)
MLFFLSIAVSFVGLIFKTGDSVASIINQILNLIAITGSIYIARRWLDKKSFESLGLKWDRGAWLDILSGIGITFVQMGFIFIVMLALSWLTFTGFAWDFDPIGTVISKVVMFFVIFVFVGWNEELLSRGYHLQTIASGFNLFWGIVISSAVFGLLHLGNPNATWVSAAGIFFAGIYLAYGYIRTKQLWLSIGLHIGWNFFEGVGFGFPVSGLDIYPLIRIQVTGPELWTGGAFGPEAGLVVIPALILGAILIYWFTKARGNS